MFLAIDYGKKRIGLALGRMIPRGAGIVDGALPQNEVVAHLAGLCEENEVEEIVMGLPIRTGGEEGTLAPEIHDFAEALSEAAKLPVIFEPEQFTSLEAESILRGAGKKGYSKGTVDELAAILILEQFLNHRAKQ